MVGEEVKLNRDCEVTLIPAGDCVVLEKGAKVYVSQALGGTVTVKNEMGMYRVGRDNLDALGVKFEEVVKDERPYSEDLVWEAMKGCYDPEIPINIVDLGLIYDMMAEDSEEGKIIHVKMTLTAQGCGMGPSIAEDAKEKIEQLNGVARAEVDIVWDPVWTPHMISDEGRKVLGM